MAIINLNAQYGITFNNDNARYVRLYLNKHSNNVCYNTNIAHLLDNSSVKFNLDKDVIKHDYVVNMYNAFSDCPNLTGQPKCGNNVIDMRGAYTRDYNLTGNPVCGPNVVEFDSVYAMCNNLTGSPICGNNVRVMSSTYFGCVKLTGSPVCGEYVYSLTSTYSRCANLTGQPVCGNNVKLMTNTYNGCNNLSGSMVIGNNVVYFDNTYIGCNLSKLNGDIYLSVIDDYIPNWKPMGNNFFNAQTNSSVRINIHVPKDSGWDRYFRTYGGLNSFCCIGGYYNLPTNMTNGYYKGNIYVYNNLTNVFHRNIYEYNDISYFYYKGEGYVRTTAIVPDNAYDMSHAYHDTYITGSPVCGNNIIKMAYAYCNCSYLTGSPICGENVVNFAYTYSYCRNINGAPVCGNNVVDMAGAYNSCFNLTGNPVCGPNVINMASAYNRCNNLTGHPVCGDNVTNMSYAYFWCNKITGSPVCGNNVTNMLSTYENCVSLTGAPNIGPNVTWAPRAYSNCSQLTGNCYIRWNGNSSSVYRLFYNCTRRINVIVKNEDMFNTIKNTINTQSIKGINVTWTTYNANCFYNGNLYIYLNTSI